MRPTRAVAYAESALAALGERRDRLAHAVLEARLGRYRLAAGDVVGRDGRAPPGCRRGPARAVRGACADPRAARPGADDRGRVQGRRAGRGRGARGAPRRWATRREPEAIHAMTTLAVVRGWGDDPESALPAPARGASTAPARRASSRSGGARSPTWPSCWSCSAGPTEAVDVTFAGMAEARDLRPRRRVRQPARRQRRRDPRGRRPLDGGPRAEPAGARLEPGRRRRSSTRSSTS